MTSINLLQLNEFNFDLVQDYPDLELLNLKRIIRSDRFSDTSSEKEYRFLEPWIQWFSVYTSKAFSEHGVFFLNDSKIKNHETIFDKFMDRGYSVGLLSPMNYALPDRIDPKSVSFYVPDPWVNGKAQGPKFFGRIADMLRDIVNNNAKGRISFYSYAVLAEVIIRCVPIGSYFRLAHLIKLCFVHRCFKAFLLDYLLVNIYLYGKRHLGMDFGSIFLNGAAHVQHHYLLTSKSADFDAIKHMLLFYDELIGSLFYELEGDVNVIMTGLSQVKYDREKVYYRMDGLNAFCKNIGIKHEKVRLRMSRDFDIYFSSEVEAREAAGLLGSIRGFTCGSVIFGDLSVDGCVLHATCKYSKKINNELVVNIRGKLLDISEYLVFVAYKNGMHQSKGFVFVENAQLPESSSKQIPIVELSGWLERLCDETIESR